MIKEEEFMNKTFGKLTAVGPIESILLPNGKRNRYVWCNCSCGGRKLVKISSLVKGYTKSCGCLDRENRRKLGEGRKNGTIVSRGNTKHSGKGTRIYSIWRNMNNRCKYPSCDNYKWYGGKGIRVCWDWNIDNPNGFINFRVFAYMNGYDDYKEIDRIDSTKDYCPENCRFIDHKSNINNQSNCVNLTYGGYTFSAAQWGELLHINPSTIRKRKSMGWTDIDALTVPTIDVTLDTYKKNQEVIKPIRFLDQKVIKDIENNYGNIDTRVANNNGYNYIPK